MSTQGSPTRPIYSKFKQDNDSATNFYSINVDEGWRSWILCTGMYEWAANQLLERLRAYPKEWTQP
jgi:hypothetical protein